MGNQLKKEYDVDLDAQNGSGGLGLRWKLYDALDLKTKEECTIFTFSKKDLPKALKKESDRMLTLLKKEVERGYKFKAPNLLKVIKPIKEFRGELAFVTERVVCSLANILGDVCAPNEENTASFVLPTHLQNYKFGALQLRSGLAQLCDAALFMHNDAHMAHGFIDPCNVYVTPTGDWKLFGFHFAEHVATENDEAHLGWDFTNDKELPFYPPFECLAPEIMISNLMTIKSDVFSIGRIAYLLHRQQAGIRRDKVIKSADEYRRYINHLNLSQSHINVGGNNQGIPFEGIPETLVETLKQTLRTDEKLRCKVEDIVNCKYLNDMIVRVIRYLEKLLEKEEDGRIKFLKKLPEVISMFDKQTLVHKVIPPLIMQLRDDRLVHHVLPSLIKITEELEPADYQQLIEPTLAKYFVSIDLPQVFYTLIDNVILLCSKSTIESRRDNLIPMALKGLAVRNVAIQTNVLKNIPVLVEKQYIEWRDLKNKLLPKLKEICNISVPANANCKVAPLRVNVLMCLAKIFHKFDTDTIKQIILKECVWTVLSRSKETAILMSVLGVCDAVAKHVSPHVVANDILPHLVPLLLQESLNAKQYATYIKCVRYMLDKIDRYRVNQLNRKDNDPVANQPQSLTENAKVKDSMHAILDQEFDPSKKGEIHKKVDDPFAAASNDSTSPVSSSNPFAQSPSDGVEDDEDDDDDNDNNDVRNDNNPKTAFSGFGDASLSPSKPTGTALGNSTNNVKPAPAVYGTKSPILTNTNNQTESFAWGNMDEQQNSFINTNENANIGNVQSSEQNANAFSSFTVTPFAAQNATQQAAKITPPSTADTKAKRRVRPKGKIKKNTKSSPNPAVANAPSTSPFGFINNETQKQSSGSNVSSMYSNYDYTTTTTTDNASGFGDMFGSAMQQKQAVKQEQSAPIFASKPVENDMFSGMQTNYAKDEDIFAGLGHVHQANNALSGIGGGGAGGGNQSGFGFVNNSQPSNVNVNQTNSNQANQTSTNTNPFGLDLGNNSNANNANSNTNTNDPFAGLF